MEFEQEKIGNVTVARIRQQKITSHEAPEMKTAFLSLIIGEGEKFLINLKNVENMDSTGLGAFLFGVRQADQHEKDMRICEVRPKVRFLIRIAHLEQVIGVYETEAEALEDFDRDEKND